MVKMERLGVVIVIVVLAFRHAQGQTTSSNFPSSPLWPIFSQLLSTQTGRSVQDINVLGLSDPTIKQLWTSYSATMAKMTQTPAPTAATPSTPPPLPDLYQSSYSFSSSNSGGSSSSNQETSSNPVKTPANTAQGIDALSSLSNSDLLSLINQLSSGGSARGISLNVPTQTITSAQDVMNAYAQFAASRGSGSSGSAGSPVGTDYQAMLTKYMTSVGNPATSSSPGNAGSSSSSPSYQSLVAQYNSLMGTGGSAGASSSGTASYDQLLQQYNQIMGKASAAASTGSSSGSGSSSSGSGSGSSPASMMEQYLALMSKSAATGTAAPSDQLLQMYKLMAGNKGAGTDSNTTTTTTTTPTPTSTPAPPQDTFEKQLATFFPQFKSLFPQPPTSNASSSSSSPSPSSSGAVAPAAGGNTAQMIFDALLFAPNKPAEATPGAPVAAIKEASTPTPPEKPADNSPMSYIQNMVNSRAGSEAILSNHVQNVFKTRASREMGCRFLPELLELDLLPTAPLNCMNRCPFPYVNSQQFGIYCVCCPPGVNEQAVGMMSLFRGTSYMETPLSVVS